MPQDSARHEEQEPALSRAERKTEARQVALEKILFAKPHRGPKKLADAGFMTGKRMAMAAVGVQVFYVLYDLATQITPFQKNLWDNVIWRGRDGPLQNARHATRDVGEGWLAEILARSRAWRGFKKKQKVAKGFLHKYVGRHLLWLEVKLLHTPTRERFEEQGKTLTPFQRTRLGVACVTRGVAAGVLAYVVVHRAGVPLAHVIGSHMGGAAQTALDNHQGALGNAVNSHLRGVGSVSPTVIAKAESLVGNAAHTMADNLVTGIPNKVVGVVAGIAAKGPNSLRAEARRMRIAGNIIDLKRSYHRWYGEPMKQAIREVAAQRSPDYAALSA